MKSKRLISTQTKNKTNSELVGTIRLMKKNSVWKEIAEILSGPRRKRKEKNLEEINQFAEENKILVIPGKILSQGEITKKVKIVSLSISKKAREKLKNSGIEFKFLAEEIRKNPSGEGVKILK